MIADIIATLMILFNIAWMVKTWRPDDPGFFEGTGFGYAAGMILFWITLIWAL